MGEKTEQWMLFHVSLMLVVAWASWRGGDLFMLQAAAAFSFAFYYILLDVNRRDLLLTKANAVTTLRLLLTLLLPDFWHYSPYLAGSMALIILAADGLDGYLARRYRQSSEAGALLDAETDAFFVLMASLLLIRHETAPSYLIVAGLLRYLHFFPALLLKRKEQGEAQRFKWAKYFAVFIMATLVAGFWLSPNGTPDKSQTTYIAWLSLLNLSMLGLLYSFGRETAHLLLQAHLKTVHPYIFALLFALLSGLLIAPLIIFAPGYAHWSNWLIPSGEWLLWSMVLAFFLPRFPKAQKPLYLFSGIFFITLLIYQTYRAFYLFTYGENPVFFYDYLLLKEVVPTFLRSSNGQLLVKFLPVTLSLPVLLWMLTRLASFQAKIAKHLPANYYSGAFALVFAGILPMLVFFTGNQQRKHIHWISPHFLHSLQSSDNRAPDFDERYNRLSILSQKELPAKPDIYWIFIEAYGAVAPLSKETNTAFRQMADSLEQKLKNAGWHIASAYSKAPIMGGRSWLSFTTALSGVRIENQKQYLYQIRTARQFPHFPRYLQTQGYTTFRLSTMYSDSEMEKFMPRDLQNSYWGFDHFIGFPQIPYRGFRFDYFGGIPDQYALSYTREQYVEKAPAPRFLFAITMSSHYPYYLPPPILDNWRALDTVGNIYARDKDLPGRMLPRYFQTIRYELEMLTQFILSQKGPAVFILLGDHQPAGLEAHLNGIYDSYATPLHIITRDSSFLPRDENFYPGLYVPPTAPLQLKHEDIWEKLVKNF